MATRQVTEDNEPLLDAVSGVLPPLMSALEALAWFARHLHPPNLAALADAVASAGQSVEAGLERFRDTEFPEQFAPFKDHVLRAGEHVRRAFEGISSAAGDPNGALEAYRALGHQTRAVEALYPVAAMLPPVSRFFLDPGYRDDKHLLGRLAKADASRDEVGILHADNDKSMRGGFSLYVPEYYDEKESWPLIVALHGGSGHGRDFLMTWLVTARTRGAILLGPTARDRTWSLMGPDIDTANIEGMVERVRERWNVDPERLLLTGMSDGGTFCYVSGLRSDSPFTHLAPSAASFHPMLLEGTTRKRLEGLRVYLMHGVLDWMFPVDIARTANQALGAGGAQVVYREIEDLSHTYPRDENPRIMDWLLTGEPSSTA